MIVLQRFRFAFLMASALLMASPLFVASACADEFELIDDSGRVTAHGQALRGRLVITELRGARSYFSRDPRFDSIDGLMVGFYQAERNRVLRFPRSGVGAIYVADLNAAAPQFRLTRRRVRPVLPVRPVGIGRRGQPGSVLTSPGLNVGSSFYRSGHFGDVYMPQTPYTSGYVAPVGASGSPYVAGYRPGFSHAPRSILLDSRTVPNPPIQPVTLQLANSGRKELRVTIVDLLNPKGTRKIAIGVGQTAEVAFQNDSGGQLVQTYRTYTPLGEPITREVTTPIPAEVRYEIVVHEWGMQSIAIDRTGKSPNVIEDVQFQGRGLGRFPLPPGNELQPGRIDVLQIAKRAGNAGAIKPLVPSESAPPASGDELQRAIFEAQKRAQN